MAAGKVIVSLTGASGSGYGYELIKALRENEGGSTEVVAVYNDTALSILTDENGIKLTDIKNLADETVSNDMMDHPLASGSNRFDHMIICPCTTSTAGKIHAGISDNLTTRLASVALKERRDLVLVVRETPLSTPTLKALYELSAWGVVIMPASPSFYNLETDSVKDLQKGFIGRILDIIGMENEMASRYDPGFMRSDG
jgi:4-hydroxy-3-polyprenylbenzoate decarboxylase